MTFKTKSRHSFVSSKNTLWNFLSLGGLTTSSKFWSYLQIKLKNQNYIFQPDSNNLAFQKASWANCLTGALCKVSSMLSCMSGRNIYKDFILKNKRLKLYKSLKTVFFENITRKDLECTGWGSKIYNIPRKTLKD